MTPDRHEERLAIRNVMDSDQRDNWQGFAVFFETVTYTPSGDAVVAKKRLTPQGHARAHDLDATATEAEEHLEALGYDLQDGLFWGKDKHGEAGMVAYLTRP